MNHFECETCEYPMCLFSEIHITLVNRRIRKVSKFVRDGGILKNNTPAWFWYRSAQLWLICSNRDDFLILDNWCYKTGGKNNWIFFQIINMGIFPLYVQSLLFFESEQIRAHFLSMGEFPWRKRIRMCEQFRSKERVRKQETRIMKKSETMDFHAVSNSRSKDTKNRRFFTNFNTKLVTTPT